MLKQFDIIFYKGESFISRVIQRVTNSEYSHVAFVLDALHLLQSDWRTPVSIHHLAYPYGHYDIYRLKISLTEREAESVFMFIRERLSAAYDWKLIFSRFFHIVIGTPIFKSEDRYNCDELIVDAFRHVGINLIAEDVIMTPDTLSKSPLLEKVAEVN
ncbi:hypothetical protein [Planococcus salinus]|uniref:Uncharacterized protein n=1 Tax=Planococcus salinus TaxID=1848460 RepID=A0A3M8P791_9BACL|nr:hypothetical protein [Planococcus salinus]RNF39548.1 hypothetical protein EEX84_08720 [Planococcus salinus]